MTFNRVTRLLSSGLLGMSLVVLVATGDPEVRFAAAFAAAFSIAALVAARPRKDHP